MQVSINWFTSEESRRGNWGKEWTNPTRPPLHRQLVNAIITVKRLLQKLNHVRLLELALYKFYESKCKKHCVN